MSAIRPRPSPRPNLLVFDIIAKITKADIEAMAESVDAAFDEFDKIDMLLIFSDFEGMDVDAAFDREALAAQVRSIRQVRKYGVVGAPKWTRAMIEISGVVSPVESKTFDLEQEAEAWAWVQKD